MNTTQEPVYMLFESKLPVRLEKRSSNMVLPPKVHEISQRVDHEFQLHPDKSEKNPSGKIPGWNGNYFSVEDHFVNGKVIAMPVRAIRVSDDLAAAHFYKRRNGNLDSCPVSSLGAYVSLFVRDNSNKLVALVNKRHEAAFISPNAWNSVGAAASTEDTDPLWAVGSKISTKYDIAFNIANILHEGIMLDTRNNYTLLTGSAIVSEEQVGGECSLTPVPVSELEAFVDQEGGIHNWLPSGLLAICFSLQQIENNGSLSNAEEYNAVGSRVWRKALADLEEHPLSDKTTLQNFGLDFEVN